jgi:acetylcholinesterase
VLESHRSRQYTLSAHISTMRVLQTLFALPAAQALNSLVVSTSSGLVFGGIDSDTPDVVHFLGVPYAEPPIRARRWLPAVRKTAECGKFIDATEFDPACPQYHSDAPSTWLTDAPENQIFPEDYQDEDCLSVNVWAPWRDNATAALPVVAWIHGGSFQTGKSNILYSLALAHGYRCC